jgi:regulator of sigma E protease
VRSRGRGSGALGCVVDLVYFVLLVGAIVLVHEFGHFAVARVFGVKVLTFSLGFGPTLLRLRGRETIYRVGLLPFGGFVKLLEERPRPRGRVDDGIDESEAGGEEPIAVEDRGRTYQAQSLPRRALIALAGPTMNIVVPLFLFFGVFLSSGKHVPATVGVVVAGSPADGVLRPGDRILAIDGRTVSTYAEVQARIAASPGRPLGLRVARAAASGPAREEALDVVVTPRATTEPGELGGTETIGRLGIGASPLAAVIGVADPNSPAARAGLRTFDVVTHVGGIATPRFIDLERRLRDNQGIAVPINYLRPSPVAFPGSSPLLEVAVYEAGVAVLAPEPFSADATDGLRRSGIELPDLFLASVPEGSSEWMAGLRPADRIRMLDGAPVKSWQSFAEDLVAGADRTREVSWTRGGRPMSGLLRVHKEEWTDASGQHVERYVWRSTHWAPTVPEPLVDEPTPVRSALKLAFTETANVVRFLVTGAVRLVQGKLTVQAISGPITIYDVAGRAGARGTRDFLWVMALISINLGLLNLLPIPTLDGGQLMFLVVEALTRRPIPIRIKEVMSIAGLTLLVMLMAVAFRNDLGRHWDTLFAPVRRLFG